MTKIMNGMGRAVSHTILMLGGSWDARDFINTDIDVKCIQAPPGAGSLFYAYRLQKAIRCHRPDILVTYNWGSIDAVIAAVLGRICPIIHNECGFGADESSGPKKRRVLMRRWLLRHVRAVAVTSRNMRDICIRQFRLPEEKVRWIRTGVDVARFRPGLPRDWRASIGVSESELLFGFLGGLRPEKDIPLLLRAFAAAAIPGARLALIGEGAERSALERMVDQLNLANSVIFAGYAADPTVCLSALDVFVLSSSTEQTSNALLEAMACGLPAIATDVGDSRELLGGGGLPAAVPAGNIKAYAEALTAMAGSAELRAQLGAANRQRCLTDYPLERMIREYEALYFEAGSSRE